jgi:hypothetical protein
MTRPLAFLITLFALIFAQPIPSPAQIYFSRIPYPRPYPPPPDPDPDSSPVEVGSYVAVGGGKVAVGAAGLYGQWNRRGLCPGLDLRLQGNSSYLHGALVGPRLAYKPSGDLHAFHPYIEALFGPNEYPRPATPFNSYLPSYRGITSAVVIGLDGDLTPHVRFRIVEYTRETFTGLAGANPYTVTTGIVLHLP